MRDISSTLMTGESDTKSFSLGCVSTFLAMRIPVFVSRHIRWQRRRFRRVAGGDRGAVATSEWRPAQRFDGIFTATTNQIVYPFDRADTGGFQAPFVPRVVEPRTYMDYTLKTRRPKDVQFPSNTRGEVTAELAVRFASEGPVIVFTTQPRWAESCATAIQRALQLRRQTQGVDIPKPFRDVSDLPHPLNSRVVAESWLGPDANVVKGFKRRGRRPSRRSP